MSYQGIVQSSATSTISDPVEMRKNRINRDRNTYTTYVRKTRFSRYYNTLASLVPIKLGRSEALSVDHAGLFSFITFKWVMSYLWSSFKNDVSFAIPECSKPELCATNSSRLDTIMNDQFIAKGSGVSMMSIIWQFIKTRSILACILYFLSIIFSLIGLVFFLPNVISNPRQNYFSIIYLISTEIIACILFSWSSAINLRTSIRIRSAIFASLFRHSLLTSLTYKLSSWQLVSFLLPEGQQIHELIMAIPYLICTPVIIICCIGFAGYELYLWGYLSVVIIIPFFPILIIIAMLSKNLMFRATIFSDKRIKLLEEFIVNNMYVKFFQKEESFRKKIGDTRNKELLNMKKAGFYDNFSFSFMQMQPVLSLTALFVAYHLNASKNDTVELSSNDNTKAQIAAVCTIMLVHLKQSLDNFWSGLNSFTKALVSLQKYKNIMLLQTIQQTGRLKPPEGVAILIRDANFKRIDYDMSQSSGVTLKFIKNSTFKMPVEHKEKFVLKQIDCIVPKGALVGVCGMPGSGKSSLLLAIMGLISQSQGHVQVDGSFAYVDQEPIIFKESLKDNILFGKELDSTLYYKVLMHCGLIDASSEIDKVNIVIDPRSLTLDHRQRISLARALYSGRDIYLLDNPLSAVDIKNCLKFFDTCILKSLNEKTRILVTDRPEFLEQCEEVWMLDGGFVTIRGKHTDLLNDPEYNKLMEILKKRNGISCDKFNPFGTTGDVPFASKPNVSGEFNIYSSTVSLDIIDATDGTHLTKEDSENDDSLWTVLKMYLLNFGNIASLFGLLVALSHGFFISALPIFFVYTLQTDDKYLYLGIYFALFGFMLIAGTVINYFFNKKMFSSAAIFHNDLLEKIYNASLTFFQEKSLGIISTVSLHLHLTDIEIPRLIHGILLSFFLLLTSAAIITIVSIWYLIPFILTLTFVILATMFVGKALLNFNCFKMDTINTLYSHVVLILSARPVIQAYNQIDCFIDRLYAEYDKYITYSYIINAARCWLVLILQILSVMFLLSICLISSLLMKNQIFCLFVSENHDKAIACFALTIVCVFQICFALQRSSILFVDSSIAFDTLSLVEDFKTSITDETENSNEEMDTDDYSIMFFDVSMSNIYYTDPIIQNMTFNVEAKEKMGFFGLSNVEEKAILSAIYRLNDIDRGTINIGLKNISQISLPKLRSTIAIIPSESHMFNEKIIDVLNPVQLYKHEDVVHIIHIFGLWERIKNLPEKLNTSVEFLSSDEKQILVLAKAYLQENKIIIIEDFSSGSLMDLILKQHLNSIFSMSTVLIFANDIECLSCCKRTVLVENGKVLMIDKTKKIQTDIIDNPLRKMLFMNNVPETCL